MSHPVEFVYALFHVVKGRLELHRAEGRTDRGATAVEYGLLVGLIAVVIIVAVTALGTRLNLLFQKIVAALPAA